MQMEMGVPFMKRLPGLSRPLLVMTVIQVGLEKLINTRLNKNLGHCPEYLQRMIVELERTVSGDYSFQYWNP
jgi:hypothetical protein